MASRPAPREIAVAEVEGHLETVARLESEQAAAEAELASLQDRVGEEVLADESAAGRLSGQMRDLRDRIDIVGRAIAAALPKLRAAQGRVVLIDAEWWDAEAARRRAKLTAHEATTARLLAQLENHEGTYVSAHVIAEMSMVDGVVNAGDGMIVHGPQPPKSRALAQAVLRAEHRAMVCRAVAAGEDPAPTLARNRSIVDGTVAGVQLQDLYPASVWGPEAILPAPAYLKQAVAAVPVAAGI